MRGPKLQSLASSFFLMLRAKNYQNWRMIHKAIQKITVACFLRTTVYNFMRKSIVYKKHFQQKMT